MDHHFQVDLRGVIAILSEHLYSGPQVYLRELLQNAVDAIHARTLLGEGPPGEIVVEVRPGTGDAGGPSLSFTDDGIGLTEAEVHGFLATIGGSSKRGEGAQDFIGRFGIGLLSCFVVSDEIVMLTRSAREPGRVIEWRGRPEGRYTVREVQSPMPVGTRVTLHAKPGFEEYFEPERVRSTCGHFGALLPHPILLRSGPSLVRVNGEGAPWRRPPGEPGRAEALRAYGERLLGRAPFDVIELRAEAGDLDGVALVLPWSPSLAARPRHVVYLKGMLLAEDVENVAPDWAFFVKCVVNSNALSPTASRESFVENAALEQTREEIGERLRAYLLNLAERDPERLAALVALHDLSIRALAVGDDEFFAIFADHLPFETSRGPMTLGEYRKLHETIRYAPSLDDFRQVARLAAAGGEGLVNGGHVYASELLERYGALKPGVRVERVDADFFAERFVEPTFAEREAAHSLLRAAERALAGLGCRVELARFSPPELPALYATSAQQRYLRSLDAAREAANPLWSSVLEHLAEPERAGPAAHAHLHLNLANPLVGRLTTVGDPATLEHLARVLYVQALLLGHHPLSARESAMLGDGLWGLVERGAGPRKEDSYGTN